MTRGLKLRQAGGSIAATLPKDMAERLHLAAGDTVLAVETDRGILLTPYDPVTEEALAIAGEVTGRYRNALRKLAEQVLDSTPRWVARLVVEAVHIDLVREHGGRPGLRDEGALEAALARPLQRFAYRPEADLAELAASYGHGLASSHPFVDGNKRIAFVTMAVFAGLNGKAIEAPEGEVVTVMIALASGHLTEAALADWLRQRLVDRARGQSG